MARYLFDTSALIAAVADEYGATVVTGSVRDFPFDISILPVGR